MGSMKCRGAFEWYDWVDWFQNMYRKCFCNIVSRTRNDSFVETKDAATRCLATCHTAMPERQGAVTPTNTKRSAVGGRFLNKSAATRLPIHQCENKSLCMFYVVTHQITHKSQKIKFKSFKLWTERTESFRFISPCCRTSRSSEVPVVMQDPEAVPSSETSDVWVWICLVLASCFQRSLPEHLFQITQWRTGQPWPT